MISDLLFLSEEDIYSFVKKATNKIILWGMGTTVIPVVATLDALNIDFDYWGSGTSDMRIHSDGKMILTYEDMSEHVDDIVLVASFAYVPIYKRLRELGVKQIYAIRDTFKYSFEDILTDRQYLSSYFQSTLTTKWNRILLELYGNIGDVIIRIGIVKAFIEQYGISNVYLLFSSIENAELYRCITDNIYVLPENQLLDCEKRRAVLENICEKQFSKSFVLCDVRIYSQRRILNKYICNIENVVFTNCLPEHEYLLGLDIDTVSDELQNYKKESLTAWGKLLISDISRKNKKSIPNRKYVAVNLGASKRTRQYHAHKFKAVCRNIITRGYDIALLGYGSDDEHVAMTMKLESDICDHMIDCVSQYSLVESAYVIANAEFFVGTDSGMWNISYALGIPSVVIYGGGEYGNFKHQDGIVKYASVDKMECFQCKWFCDKTDEYGTAECIYGISPDLIISTIDELLLDTE